MSKLIVEMKMPRHCNECACFYGGICFANNDPNIDAVLPQDTLIERPSWCPIKGVLPIDAVEVVRCGKCGLRYKPLDDDARNEIYCEFIGSTMRKDDFCSYGCADGERRDPCSSQDS